MAATGWGGRGDAQITLAALRATYEPLLDGLARYLLLDVPNWLPGDDAADHWEGGHRGLIARRLIEELGDRSGRVPSAAAAEEDERLWRRLRTRLREE
jgi:hypothetical protein